MKRSLARSRRGFTLVEIMIVSALIALLSSIAVFSINEFYKIQIRKATLGECRQIATALSFAHDDLAFFPRLNWLDKPKVIVETDMATGTSGPGNLVVGIDYYGFIPGVPQSTTPYQTRVNVNWGGSYFGMSQNRTRGNRGGRSGICKVRLVEALFALGGPGNPQAETASIVDYPADNYGQPYVLYQMKAGLNASNNVVPIFPTQPTQEGDYITAVVSYGPNGFPGGNENTYPQPTGVAVVNKLKNGALFKEGDYPGCNAPYDPNTIFTLRTLNTSIAGIDQNYVLTTPTVYSDVLDAMYFPGVPDEKTGQVGMLDKGSDDLMIKF